MNIVWLLVLFYDTVIKAFQYGVVILLPLLVVIIVINIKKNSIKNSKKVIRLLWIIFFGIVFTSRLWGPKFYKYVIGVQITNKEKQIQNQLEKKYNKNFSFISKGKVEQTDDYGPGIGENVDYDYSVTYKFKDDDGVVAIVEYKKGAGWDYYQVKRAEYDIEQAVYNYAKKNGVKQNFYIKVLNRFDSGSRLNDSPESNFINDNMTHDDILFVTTEEMENSKSFVKKALNTIYTDKISLYVYEYEVTEDEYQKIKNYYESDEFKQSFSEIDEENIYVINKSSIIYSKGYYLY